MPQQQPAANGSNFFDVFRTESSEAMPKYQQLRFAILEAIRTGHWRDGERLPTEDELVDLTGYSLGTVQRAVRMLAEDGVLSRRQGSGTFVSGASSRIAEPWHFQFLDDDGESLIPAYPKIVKRERTDQKGPWSRFLGRSGEKTLRVDRVINVNDEFTAFSRFFVRGANAKTVESMPIEALHGANFRVLLSDACRLPVTRITHTVSIVRATSEQASRIRVARREQVLKVEISATAGSDTPFYYQELFCPPSERKLSLPGVGRF